MKIWKTIYPNLLNERKRVEGIGKISEENGYNDELKDIYLREVIDRNKEYEWDLIFDQTFDLLQTFF